MSTISLSHGRRTQLRLPLSPVRAQMALSALEAWRQPDAGERRGWFAIRNAAAPGPTQVNIFDEISWWGVSAQEFCDLIGGIDGDLEVHINSPGGDAFDGVTIFNALNSRKGRVRTVIDGLAASAASVIFMAGDEREVALGGMGMIHDALALCMGNAADMRETAALLDKVSDSIASVYAAKAGGTPAQWRATMAGDAWYSAQELVDAGLAHSISAGKDSAGDLEMAAWSGRRLFDMWQGPLRAAYDPDGDGDDDSTAEGDTDHDHWNADGTHKPMTVTHAHEHADGDGGEHSHSHSHSDDADHMHSHASARGPHIRNAGADESDWDGPAAMSAASKADDPAAALSAICAGKRAGDPKTQEAHALPHHKHPGDPPNRHGVSNALARFSSTQGLTNEEAAKAHLEAHQSAMGSGGSSDKTDDELWAELADPQLFQLEAGKE